MEENRFNATEHDRRKMNGRTRDRSNEARTPPSSPDLYNDIETDDELVIDLPYEHLTRSLDEDSLDALEQSLVIDLDREESELVVDLERPSTSSGSPISKDLLLKGPSRLEASEENVQADRYVEREFVFKKHEELLSAYGAGFTTESRRMDDLSQYPSFDLSEGTRVDIRDLFKSQNEVLFGRFLLCRILAPPCGSPTVYAVVDDPDGVLAVSVTLQDFVSDSEPRTLGDYPQVGCVLALRNPCFKYNSVFRGLSVHSHRAEDVEPLLYPDLLRLRVQAFAAEIPPQYRTMAFRLERSAADDMRSLGNEYFKMKMFPYAVQAYNDALKLDPFNKIILDNRSAAYLKMGDFVRAMADADSALAIDAVFLKAQYRKAISLCGLKRHQTAIDFLTKCIPEEEVTNQNVLKDEAIRLRTRLKRQLLGVYDLKYFARKHMKCDGFNAFVDCADYLSKKVRITFVEGRGRGVVAREDIKAGQLIMACKSFAFYDPENDLDDKNLSKATDDTQVKKALRDKLQGILVEMLLENPTRGMELYHLWAGPKLGRLNFVNEQSWPGIDSNRLDGILLYNATYNKYPIMVDNVVSRQQYYIFLSVKPSFINHDCLGNCTMDLYRDFTFVKTWRDVKKGEEITASYFNRKLTYGERRTLMQELKFTCTCSLCEVERVEPVFVHQKIGDTLKKMKPYMDGSPLTGQGEALLSSSLKLLKEIRPGTRLNYYLDDIYSALVTHHGDRGQIWKAMDLAKEAYLWYEDSPFISSKMFYLTLMVSTYHLSGRRYEMNLWSPKLKELLETHADLHPGFDDVLALLMKNVPRSVYLSNAANV